MNVCCWQVIKKKEKVKPLRHARGIKKSATLAGYKMHAKPPHKKRVRHRNIRRGAVHKECVTVYSKREVVIR